MIFVTIGSMFPFDRLIRSMDEWAARHADKEIFAQIGDGSYEPRNMRYVRRLSQADFQASVQTANLVVAHAGMGTVISVGQVGHPLVVLPRQHRLGEHNTNHQEATARWLKTRPGIYVADTEADLDVAITQATMEEANQMIPNEADPLLLQRLRKAVLDP